MANQSQLNWNQMGNLLFSENQFILLTDDSINFQYYSIVLNKQFINNETFDSLPKATS